MLSKSFQYLKNWYLIKSTIIIHQLIIQFELVKRNKWVLSKKYLKF